MQSRRTAVSPAVPSKTLRHSPEPAAPPPQDGALLQEKCRNRRMHEKKNTRNPPHQLKNTIRSGIFQNLLPNSNKKHQFQQKHSRSTRLICQTQIYEVNYVSKVNVAHENFKRAKVLKYSTLKLALTKTTSPIMHYFTHK